MARAPSSWRDGRPPPCPAGAGAAYNRRVDPPLEAIPLGAFADVARRRKPRPPRPDPGADAADAARPPAGLVGEGPGDARPRVGLALPPPLLPGRPRGPGRLCARRPGARAAASRRGPRSRAGPGPRAAPVLRRPRPQGRLRRHAGRHRPPGDPRRPDRRSRPRPSARPWSRPTRSTRSPRSPSTSPTSRTTARSSATARGSTPRARLQDQGRRLRRAARPDEQAAALPRVPRLALPLLLPDEQDAPGGPELVPPARSRSAPS